MAGTVHPVAGTGTPTDVRVVLVVLDAVPPDAVDPEATPTLHRLATDGGHWPAGAEGVLPALTYPAHATFVTGRDPVDHGLVANHVHRDGAWVRADAVGPTGPTIFDAATAGGRRSLAVVGDHHLIGVCGAERATVHWPPGGRFPDDHDRSITGYLHDDAVVDALAAHDPADFDLVVVQLDEVDATQHVHGPGTATAASQVTRTDAALGRLVDWLTPVWDEVVVVVVSDHHQEVVDPDAAAIDPTGALPAHVAYRPQGTVGLVVGTEPGDLAALDGIEGTASLSSEVHLVWGPPGSRFGPVSYAIPGDHGSPRTSRQLAVVGGGHRCVADVVARADAAGPTATTWAPLVAHLLGVGDHLAARPAATS